MKMLEIFKETVKESPVELRILSAKEAYTKSTLRVEYKGAETTVELRNTCTPGEEKNYCWYVLATAMSSIYLNAGDVKRGKLWLDSAHDRNIITTENA